MTIYKALEGITFSVTLLSITVSTTDEAANKIHYSYSDGYVIANSLEVFLSYHAPSIQRYHSQIVADFPEYFI